MTHWIDIIWIDPATNGERRASFTPLVDEHGHRYITRDMVSRQPEIAWWLAKHPSEYAYSHERDRWESTR